MPFRDVRERLSQFVNRLMSDQRRVNLDELIRESGRWIPKPQNYTYHQEMQRRLDYFRGAMQADMKDELERRFPQTHKSIEKEQVNLPLVRKMMQDKAKVFGQSSEFTLIAEDGSRIEGEQADKFDKFLDRARVLSALKQADLYTQLCHRSMLKSWWDQRAKCVRISIWPSNLVWIVPDPLRWWDVDSAYAVLFELPGVDGLWSTKPRYEVWGMRDPSAAEATGQDTVHFVTDGRNDWWMNDQDRNPFIDPRTGGPVYPFVWWQDEESTELYTLGYEDMLTINRTINATLTDMRQAIHYKAWGVWVHTPGPGSKGLGVKTISPSNVVDLAEGGRLENIDTNLPIGETWEWCKDLMQQDALFNGLSPSAVRSDVGAPESGYALKIRNRALIEHRENMIETYRPFVEESIYRALLVHNMYHPDKIDTEGLRVHWEPGEMDLVEDPQAIGETYAAEIISNVSSPIDWRMARTGENRQMAEEAVRQNAELNRELTKRGSLPWEGGSVDISQYMPQPPRPGPEEPEEPEE